MPTGNSVELQYTIEEDFPCVVACSIHPWMRGYVMLRANPYMAVSNRKGDLTIRNLPVGAHQFRIWHERMGWVRQTTVGAQTTDAKGRITVKITPGTNEFLHAPIVGKHLATR